ncbi:hypothetical protein GQ602_002633 [Ophiocordyceps camponoti-floridani]|uniref:Mtf2-like C-terminal domain-containing protein n=1 Tax=Ophiocordyceps camponoti-floridani TaxID=2030778 RepID=A0A8H4VFT9_9HYPO|nr:hypothetical protein GQ602_002633 [Ophiocordyceps camponoti-floridani]
MLSSVSPARARWRILACPVISRLSRRAHTDIERKHDNAIPFDWGDNSHFGEQDNGGSEGSTITPSEAYIFKSIFEEIATGRMPPSKKRSFQGEGTRGEHDGSFRKHRGGPARSIVEQARITEFREKFLCRYPQSLQVAAKMALRMFETDPSTADNTTKVTEVDKKKLEEAAEYEAARTEERVRVEALMKGCATDVALWKVMEDEVFSLPSKLGIVPAKKRIRSPRRSANAGEPAIDARKPTESESIAKAPDSQKLSMDIHGPLYPHFLEQGLDSFDTAFVRSSPYALQILPRIKALGLCSYVLGVSTTFYVRLARIQWTRYGDGNAALDVLQELSDSGLYVDNDVRGLLGQMRDNLHGCTWGAQGPFVTKMMEFPPYDGAFARRLEKLEAEVKQALQQDVAQ